MVRVAQRPLLAPLTEVRFVDEEDGEAGGDDGAGNRGAVDAPRMLMISRIGGDGAVWDSWRKRTQRRILRMHRKWCWTCIVLGAVDRSYARKV